MAAARASLTPVELVTERLILRRWRTSDREPFARMNADSDVMRYFPRTLTREESDAFLDRVMERLGMTHNPADDFEHPNVPDGNPLKHQVLYRISSNTGRSVAAATGSSRMSRAPSKARSRPPTRMRRT
jgi:Acetyltransferase (GNAT) domain